jgi:hypothetical protein
MSSASAMKRLFLLFACIAALGGCCRGWCVPNMVLDPRPVAVLQGFPEPGACMPAADRGYFQTVHRGGDLCVTTLAYDGIAYSTDKACRTGIVLSIETTDPHFRTPEGLQVGESVSNCLDAGGVLLDTGDIMLPSGWKAQVQTSSDPSPWIRSFRKDAPKSDWEAATVRD